MNNEQILKDNEKMIWSMTNYFYGVDKNDLFQAGVLGLFKALKKYKSNGNTKFSTYAYDYIYGEMWTLANNRNIKISKDILKTYKKLEQKRYALAQEIGHIPSNLELSEYTGISLDAIFLAECSAKEILSLDNKQDDERSPYETVMAKEEDLDTKILINDSLEVLNDSEKDILVSRYFEDLTQSEVAKKLNMTQVMVSRYEKKGISKIRQYLTL